VYKLIKATERLIGIFLSMKIEAERAIPSEVEGMSSPEAYL